MSGEIKINNVTKIFNQGAAEEVIALNGVDFTIPAGSFVSLIGPSGCGKTTLLRCIAGLETPTSGEVDVDGTKITKPGSDRGFAFQQANLFPWLTIRDNIAFGLRARHIYKKRKADVDEFIKLVGLAVESLGFPNPILVDFSGADEATKASLVASLPYSVAVLHTVFNVITTLILVWFIPQLVKMVTWMVPNKGEEKEVYRLKYIGIGNIATGDLALNSAKMEVVEFGRLCRRDLGYIRKAINAGTLAEFEEADKKLVHYEEITDNVEREIATYLQDVSKNEMSIGGLARIREFYRVIGEMESLGDSGETIGKILQRVWEHKCHFTDRMLEQLNHLLDLLDQAYVAMDLNLSTPLVELSDIHNAEDAETAINEYRDVLRNEHLTNIEKSSYPYETGSFYMDVVNCIEKMGDFLINISQSVLGAKTV